MRKMIIMLVCILGMAACDKSDEVINISKYETFRIGIGNESVTVGELIKDYNVVFYIEDEVFVLVYTIDQTKFTLVLKESYSIVTVRRCAINNEYQEYIDFKQEFLRQYFS